MSVGTAQNEARARSAIRVIFAVLVLVILVLVFNRGVVAHLDNRIDHAGDPLLNAWIISWNLHALKEAPATLWHANIFYPHRYTLAYSENLIVPSILVMPVSLFTSNPTLLYNLAFILGFVLSSVAAYLLGLALTRSHLLGIFLGVAFALSPFRLAHAGHLQMQHGEWMVFAFLFIIVYFRRAMGVGADHSPSPRHSPLCAFEGSIRCSRYGWLLAACIVTQWQFLSNMYFFMFAAPALAILQGAGLWMLAPNQRRAALVELAAFWAVLAAIVAPFAWPYIAARGDVGLARGPESLSEFSASLGDYLAYNKENVWFGRFSNGKRGVEFLLCPGILIMLAATLPCWRRAAALLQHPATFCRRLAAHVRQRPLVAAIDAIAAITAVLLVMILCGRGLEFISHGGTRIGVTRPGRPALVLLLLLGLRARLSGIGMAAVRQWRPGWTAAFWAIAAFAVLMSLGPDRGPYGLFYRLVPGYDALRAPARFAGVAMPALGAIAVLNVAAALRRVRSRRIAAVVCAALASGLVLEYWSAPRPMRFEPGSRPVYAWLATAPDGAVMELPLPRSRSDIQRDAVYEFCSTYHWKPLFNGYSGYTPPEYHTICRRMDAFPSEDTVQLLRDLGIRYVVVHRCDDALQQAGGQHMALAARFGEDCVFEVADDAGNDSGGGPPAP